MRDIMAGLELLLAADAVFYLVLGLVAGFVVGVLPGFQGASGAALALPFSVALPVEQALLLMVGIYAGATFSGSVPAILINVPGTAGAAATAIDGYPLARMGKAEMAIGVARVSSVVGGTLAILIILGLIGPISSIALSFGSREMFAVAILGLVLIGSLVGRDAQRGVLCGLFGMLIAMMSASPVHGQPRLTFGFAELYEGVPFVPVLIGLFAYSQMFALAIETTLTPDEADDGTSDSTMSHARRSWRRAFHGALDGLTVPLRYPRTLARSSLIGTVVGVIPGAGAAIGNFLSYGAAKRASNDPDQFGQGTPEGIVASEAADNAVTGGTLVPTLTLGLPGSASAAIMLAALILHGVQPGPRVMATHAAEAYSVILGLGLASLLILPIGIVLALPMAQVVRVKPGILVPIVLLVSAVGVFAVRRMMFDVVVALIFGVIGLLLTRHGYPVVPIILGMILGPLAESHLLRGLDIGRDSIPYFLGSTTAKILWSGVAALLIANVFRRRRRRSRMKVSTQ